MTVAEPTWGHVAADELASIVVVSPHLDDAVLGSAHLLDRYPGSTVVTTFAGRPAEYPDPPTDWDAAGGFRPGDDVVALRRDEDRRALEQLATAPVWLDFVDHQYLEPDERPADDEVATALDEAIGSLSPSAVFLPMGLANPDHVTTHGAGMIVRSRHPEIAWFCYEDAGYKHLPGLLAWRVTKLFRSGAWPTPAVVPVGADVRAKRSALECYRSQIPPLERDHGLTDRLDANVPEQYWRLAPPPEGWEGLVDLA